MVATMLTGTAWNPKPSPSAASDASMVSRTGATAGAHAATAATPRPATATQRTPRRRSHAGAAAEPATMPTLSGSNAKPATAGESPARPCSHSELT